MTNDRTLTVSLLLALGAAAGCTADADDADDTVPGGAQLTIVGERTLQLENGWATELRVRYSDMQDHPLAGTIQFALAGEVGGAFLSADAAATDAAGEATITLTSGEVGDATFDVEADAAAADPVRWDVAVLRRALDVTGTYRIRSDFDLASGLPGTAGTVIAELIEMTDDPYDPATYVLDKVEASVSSSVRTVIHGARPTLDAILNEVLLEATPDVVARLVDLGDGFGQIAHRFGTTSQLTVTASTDVDTDYTAQHVLDGLVFTIDDDSYPYALADLGLDSPTAAPSFSYDAQRFTLGEHAFPLSYGTILIVALDQIVIPSIDADATDLRSLLGDYVDCADIGDAIAEYVGFGSVGLYEGACDLGLDAAAGYVDDRIRSLDGTAMQLGIHGAARWTDSNHDHAVDVLQNGAWEGQMTYGATPAPLGPSTFRGERMASPQ